MLDDGVQQASQQALALLHSETECFCFWVGATDERPSIRSQSSCGDQLTIA